MSLKFYQSKKIYQFSKFWLIWRLNLDVSWPKLDENLCNLAYFPTIPVVSMSSFSNEIHNARKMLIFLRGSKKVKVVNKQDNESDEITVKQRVQAEDADIIQKHLQELGSV